MQLMKTHRIFALAAALLFGMTSAVSAQLLNGGFEDPDTSGGDVYCTTSWGCFGDVFSSSQSAPPRTGNNVLKIFGPFGAPFGGAGAVQSVPAAPGQTWVGEVYAQHWTGDALNPDDFAVYKIEFLDAGNQLVDCGPGPGVPAAGCNVFESPQFNNTYAVNTWHLLGVGTAPAPAGTVSAQAVIVKVNVNQGGGGGSIFWDDASLRRVTVAVEEGTFSQVKVLYR